MRIKIKLKIKELLEEKNVNKTELSVNIGKEKSFINSILSQPNKFFNLEHIEKICAALNYPVAKLFEDDVCSQKKTPSRQVAQNLADPMLWALIKVYEGLSFKHKGTLRDVAEELRLTEALPQRELKKESAVP